MKRATAVRMAYRVASAVGIPKALRRVRDGACVFCFHNIVNPSEVGLGDTSLHMARDDFERTMDWMTHAYTVVGLDELGKRIRDGRSTSGLAAVTFDDAYEGFIRNGLPVLARHGLPAAVFVVSEAAEAPSPFWWDQLGAAGSLSDSVRETCLTDHRGVASEILADLERDAVPVPPLPQAFLPATWSRIADAVGGCSDLMVGSHTLTHPNLTRASSAELQRQLQVSRVALSERLGLLPVVISYPYGLHDARVQEEARACGYELGLTLDRGLARAGADPLAIPRLNVPAGAGVEALECWAAGLRPR